MKMKSYLIIVLILCFKISFAQVGVGTIVPDAQLDIRSSNQASPAIDDGILIPKVDNLIAVPTIAQQGMLVYLTTNLSPTFQKGFYYWDFPTLTWIGISSTANGDHDWYEEGTTLAPNAITDDMFHTGNLAIGKNTANFPLEVNNTSFDIGVNNDFNNATTNTIDKTGISNTVGGSTNDDSFGLKNSLTGTGTGVHYANYNTLSGTGTGNQFGTYTTIPNTGNGNHYGSYTELTGSGMGAQYGAFNLINITNNSNTIHTGVHNQISGTSNGVKNGTINEILNTGNGIHVGLKNFLTGTGTGIKYGTQNYLNTSGTANNIGIHSQITGSTSGALVGFDNYIANNSNGNHFGIFNTIGGSGNGLTVGVTNTITSSGTGDNYGVNSEIYSSGSGNYWATRNIINSIGNGTQYGTWNQTDGTGTGTKYANYNSIGSLSGGTHYGVYSSVLKPGATNFAGYFLGNVGIGTTTANTYIFPPSRGTVGQILRTDGTGNVTWANNSDFAWSTLGNAGTTGGTITTAGTNFIGTTDAQNLDFRTGGVYRGRFSSLGEFFVGTLNTALAGDLMNAVGNATFPWAINGYTSNDGGGVYGSVQAGTTNFSSVQGEYYGSGLGSGVFGSYGGTNISNIRAGVTGSIPTTNIATGGTAVLGNNQASSGNQHMGVLGLYNGSAFGIGVYGLGFGGGLITGNNDIAVVGWRANNANYSGYFNGNHVITNGTKTASVGTSKGNQLLYVTELPEVWFEDVGGGQLVNGSIHIQLDPIFLETIFVDATHPMRVFLQEEGESNGLIVIKDADNKGFIVKEKNGGTSNITFSFRIMAKRLHFQDHRFGNDPLWGEGDTRQYNQYATPPPINYNENVRFQEEQKKNYKPTPMPKGFIDYFQLQEEAKKAETRIQATPSN